jgi:CRISPR/Cas system CMR-associated protein Cmr5 small subunit
VKYSRKVFSLSPKSKKVAENHLEEEVNSYVNA